ncbi:MAG: hypothetical protein AVDCRST_MAG27-2790, partial [uncultured Craurococcus sp.]
DRRRRRGHRCGHGHRAFALSRASRHRGRGMAGGLCAAGLRNGALPCQSLGHRAWRAAALDGRPGGGLRRALLRGAGAGAPGGDARSRLPLHRPGGDRRQAGRGGAGRDGRAQCLLRPHRGLRCGGADGGLRRLHPPVPGRERGSAGSGYSTL